jgi:hypothetical protein
MADVKVDRIGEAFAVAALDLGAEEGAIHVSHDDDWLELLVQHEGREGSIRVQHDGIPSGVRARASLAESAARSVLMGLGMPLPASPPVDPVDVAGSDEANRAAREAA